MLNDLDQEAAKQIVHFFVCFFFFLAPPFLFPTSSLRLTCPSFQQVTEIWYKIAAVVLGDRPIAAARDWEIITELLTAPQLEAVIE